MSGLDDLVAARLREVRARIAAAGGAGVDIVAITKTFGLDAAFAAHRAGCAAVGESYAQEAAAKFGGVDVPFEVRFVGHLQTNKVRLLAPFVAVYESVDRRSLIQEIARRAPGARVLVQVNATGEPNKGGCPPEELDRLVGTAFEAGLQVEGLMTIGPTKGGPDAARPAFALVRAAVDRLGLRVCSMGMSDDLEVAVAEGTTEVRVGTALFGARHSRR